MWGVAGDLPSPLSYPREPHSALRQARPLVDISWVVCAQIEDYNIQVGFSWHDLLQFRLVHPMRWRCDGDAMAMVPQCHPSACVRPGHKHC